MSSPAARKRVRRRIAALLREGPGQEQEIETIFLVQSNLALREIFVTAYLSLKVKFLLKSSFINIISEPYISLTKKRKTSFPLSLSFPVYLNLPNSQYIQQIMIDKYILSKTTNEQVYESKYLRCFVLFG